MDYKDLWPLIQADILGVIAADDFLGTRGGVIVEPGDIESVINTKLAKIIGAGLDGKSGVGFLVMPIERASDENVNLPGGPLKLNIMVQWVENVLINNSSSGTGTPIRVYAAACEKLLKLYTPVGLTNSLVPATPVITEFTDNTNKNLRCGNVDFTASEADFQPFKRLGRPQITVAGSVTQMPNGNSYQIISGQPVATVNAVAGAMGIYYTTDGSHPYQNNPQATLYSGPVTIAGPCLFRARAFAPGYAGSDTAAANFFS